MSRIPFIKIVCLPALLLAGCLLARPAAAQHGISDGADAHGELFVGAGMAAFAQVDGTVSALHYRGALAPLFMGYATARGDRRQSWVLQLQKTRMTGEAGNTRDFHYLRFGYRYLVRLAEGRFGDGSVRLYGGGGPGGRFARVGQSIVHPTYTSSYTSGYWAATLNLQLRAEADLLPRLELAWAAELPLVSYLVTPDWSRRWPSVMGGYMAGPGKHLAYSQHIEARYAASSRIQAGLRIFHSLARVPEPKTYASVSRGLYLTLYYAL